ncbi:MAG: Ni/Fe hydrogenase subunit alpha [Verrucomicrobiae bacterium]|nr:Ni/Fe hydrogenase subunit alpha [Verrucomicrobiae bacterium]MDW8342930.1 Ni/Fe hydrogenase subunit alpha [Verrucomicrobiae bacterium]
MSNTITINPVTRIEGHAKITIHLDSHGEVDDARFHVVEFRGFEKFCEGRYFTEMVQITPRSCGICPVSHLLASAKACDAIVGVTIPRTAKMLRELMHMGQIIQSHALSFFHLSAPDLLLGFDSDPATRNVMGLIAAQPEIALKGIRLRKFGQEIIKATGGRKIHAEFPVPGGVNKALTEQERDALLAGMPEAYAAARFALDLLLDYHNRHQHEVESFASFDSNYVGLVQPDGALELYDGKLRFCNPQGGIIHDQVDPARYLDYIREASEGWSFMKFPFILSMGYPQGMYRVGPLARVNLCTKIATPKANAELRLWRSNGHQVRTSSFYYHWARLIELLYGLERAEQLLRDPEITSTEIVVHAEPQNPEGVGVIEAPRGTLIHHYWVDRSGRIEKVNLIVATGHNNLAMNRAVRAVAKKYVKAQRLQEGMLNRVEAAIRCYDPCLSCATHAVGQMPMRIELVDANGQVIDTLSRPAP